MRWCTYESPEFVYPLINTPEATSGESTMDTETQTFRNLTKDCRESRPFKNTRAAAGILGQSDKPRMLPAEPTDDFPYKIGNIAGDGASGIVYHASEPSLRRDVAIKFLKAKHGMDENLRSRFTQEALAAAGLSHPGVVTIHKIDSYRGTLYIVMEWVDGKTLVEHVREGALGQLPLDEAIEIASTLLEILANAHDSGIIHRDVKPSNLIFTSEGRLKLTDFGIARLAEDSLVQTVVGTVLATPKFASPEQLSGKEVDARSDLFSVALVFYYMLCGRAPFKGNSTADTMRKILTANPVSIRDQRPDVPENFDKFLKKAMAKSPQNRFQDAREMRDALQVLLNQHETVSRPEYVIRCTDKSPAVALGKLLFSWPYKEYKVKNVNKALQSLSAGSFHTEPFNGVAHVGHRLVFIVDGQTLGALDTSTDAFCDIPKTSKAATLYLYKCPRRLQKIFPDLVGLSRMTDLDQSALNATVIDLPRLFLRLRKKQHTGSVCMNNSHGYGLFVFADGRIRLALLGGNWSKQSTSDFTAWLQSLVAQVIFYQTPEQSADTTP